MSTMTTTSPETASPLKRLIIHHPLIAFFAIAFAGEWIAFLPLVLAQNGLGVLPYTIPEIGLVPVAQWFALPASILGPTLASFTVTAITGGKAGVQQLLRRYMLWRVGLRWYLLVLVGVPLIQLACASFFLGTAPLTAFLQQWPSYFTVYLPNVLIIAVAVQIWEEGGWSGFAIPRLQQRFGAWRAVLIFGPLWALFHLPVFFVPGQIFDQKVGAVTMIVQMALLIILATLTRIIMTWVFNNTKGSILIAILLHAALDASNGASDYIHHLLPASQLGGYSLGATLVVPLAGAVLLLILTKGKLSYKPEPAPQGVEVSQPAEMPSTSV
ncbi:MAG TPA: CPBP family intramembrane glutamic endopeptidase [Ktedonobacteraceae bacterium]|nr:CPBP family intramembrane glutamic endopeptidase [Ktedonobacteraceae bacterium]